MQISRIKMAKRLTLCLSAFFNQPATDINGTAENLSVLQLSKFNILTECSLATFLYFVIGFIISMTCGSPKNCFKFYNVNKILIFMELVGFKGRQCLHFLIS